MSELEYVAERLMHLLTVLALKHARRPYKESYALLYRQQREVERRMADAPSTNRYVDPLRETAPLYIGDPCTLHIFTAQTFSICSLAVGQQPSQPRIPGILQDPDPCEQLFNVLVVTLAPYSRVISSTHAWHLS